jgi:hypothetical protein
MVLEQVYKFQWLSQGAVGKRMRRMNGAKLYSSSEKVVGGSRFRLPGPT